MGAGDTTIDAEHKHSFYFLILSISFPRVMSLLVIASTSNDFRESLTAFQIIELIGWWSSLPLTFCEYIFSLVADRNWKKLWRYPSETFRLCEYYYIETFLQHTIIYYVMSDKNEIQEPGLGTEDAKKFELNEKPKPTRKVSHPSTPISNKDEPSTHDKRKGRRIVK